MNRVNDSKQRIRQINRVKKSNRWVGSKNRINVPSRCIEPTHGTIDRTGESERSQTTPDRPHGGPGVLLRALGAVLGMSWGGLGLPLDGLCGSWAVLGRSRGGPLLDAPGCSWDGLGCHLETNE